jgi:hypothetical protein
VKIATFIFCSVLHVISTHAGAAAANEVPKCLNVWSSGYWTGWHHVELVGDMLLYWRNPRAPRDTDTPERIKPSAEKWEQFRKELDSIDIWCWHSDYSTDGIFDATAWRADIDYSDRSIVTGGDGGVFPEKDGAPGSDNSPTAYQQYSRYVKALQALLDCDTFR